MVDSIMFTSPFFLSNTVENAAFTELEELGFGSSKISEKRYRKMKKKQQGRSEREKGMRKKARWEVRVMDNTLNKE